MTRTGKYVSRWSAVCAALPLMLWAGSAAYAQSAPSLTTPSLPAPERGTQGSISLPAAAPDSGPPGGEQILLTLKSLELEGARPREVDVESAWRPLANQSLSVAQLYALAGEIERRYSAAGYPLIRVVVPAQDFDAAAATPRFRVISGVIRQVDVAGVPARLREAITRQVAPLVNREFVTDHALQHQLLAAGDLAGATFRAAIGPGAETGEVVLILTAETPLWQTTAAGDNSLSRALGDRQLIVQTSLLSPLGFGERIRLMLAGSPNLHAFDHEAPRRYALVGVSVPVGSRGLIVGFDVSHSGTVSGSGDVRFRGALDRLALNASYPLWLRRDSSLVFNAELEKLDEALTSVVTGGKLSQDGVVSLQAGLELRGCNVANTCASGEFSLRRGLDALGARTRGDVDASGIPFSKGAAEPQFSTVVMGARANGALAAGTLALPWRLGLRAQHSLGGTLFTSQQFGVSGSDSVSGLDSGALSGDKGYWVRGELGAPAWRAWPGLAGLPYGFAASGSTWLERPTATERERTSAQSFGAGVRWSLQSAGQAVIYTATLELAHTRTNALGSDRDGTNNLGFRLGVSF